MERNFKLKEEKNKIKEEIKELWSKRSKAENTPDKDGKLSWTRDDEIAKLDKEIEEKQARLKEINKVLGECNSQD